VNSPTRMSRDNFVVNDVIPVIGEMLSTVRETGNAHNLLRSSIAVVKSLHRERRTVGHLPQKVSSLCSTFPE